MTSVGGPQLMGVGKEGKHAELRRSKKFDVDLMLPGKGRRNEEAEWTTKQTKKGDFPKGL